MDRVIVIGDIHGCVNTLKELLYNIIKINKSDKLIFLGDYIDRGLHSREVIDELIYLKNNNYNTIFLRGNHEQMLLDTYFHPELYPQWLINGAANTLSSFRINNIKDLDENYLRFFQSTKFYYEIENYVIVHAGLNFELENPLNDIISMLWTRNLSIDKSKINNRKLIVGHTPKLISEIKESIYKGDTIFLDGGVVYNDMKTESGKGNLVAYDLINDELFYLENSEK